MDEDVDQVKAEWLGGKLPVEKKGGVDEGSGAFGIGGHREG